MMNVVKSILIASSLLFVTGCDNESPNPDLGIAVYDKSGNIYTTVKIGDQTWLKENLRTTQYNSGDEITTTFSATTNISSETNPKYQWSYFNGTDPVGSGLGLLYTWHVLTDSRGVCPPGFRIPTDEDWNVLASFLGGNTVAGGKLKITGTGSWNAPNTGASNEANFNGMPGGYRLPSGTFQGIRETGLYWTTTSSDTDNAVAYSLSNQNAELGSASQNKKDGIACRCIKN